uniref:Secreted protein n=1 Tax=Timema poppense TaxID=170557 RepID=A0A7R9DHL3_TIMPO|nr:unnamed protein product [Timema poppensis]
MTLGGLVTLFLLAGWFSSVTGWGRLASNLEPLLGPPCDLFGVLGNQWRLPRTTSRLHLHVAVTRSIRIVNSANAPLTRPESKGYSKLTLDTPSREMSGF